MNNANKTGFNYRREATAEERAICAEVWMALDGCNLIGLLNGWARWASLLHTFLFGNKALCESVNDHPVMLVMLDKLADLRGHNLHDYRDHSNGMWGVHPDGESSETEVSAAYRWVCVAAEAHKKAEQPQVQPAPQERVMVANARGTVIDYEAAVQLMDDGLREELHGGGEHTAQEFIAAYAAAHKERFGEDFAPWVGGAW